MTATRILIVEDEIIAAKSLELRLGRLGYTVTGIIAFGEQALTAAQTQHADLVLMDIDLRGDMDGITAAELIRTQLDVPVIFTTSHDDDNTLQRAKISDAFGYLVKPFETRDIRTSVEMALYKHATERKLRESEQRYRLIAERTGQLLYDCDLTSGKIEWQGLVETLTGYTIAEFANLDLPGWVEHIHPSDREQASALLNQGRQSGTPYTATYRFRKKDGAYFDVEDNGIFLRNEQGEHTRLLGTIKDISARRQAEQALANERTLLRTVIHNLPDLIYVKDLASRYVLNNPAHLHSLGAAQQEDTLGKTAFHFFPEHLAARFYADEQRVLDTGESLIESEETVLDPYTDTLRWHLTSKVPLRDAQNQIIGLVGISRDITERKHAQDELAREKVLFEQLFENAPVGIVMLDEQERVKRINAAFEQIFQFSPDQIVGKFINDLIAPPSHIVQASQFLRQIMRGNTVHEESVRQRRDGTLVLVESYGIPVKLKQKTIGLYTMYVDITERKRAQEQLQFASTHDALTGIFNRAYFEEALEKLRHGSEYPVSIIMIDVDRLKQTNDTLGHAVGDQLLRSAANVLQTAFRDNDIVARIGGDEFAILLPHTDQTVTTDALARIHKNLAAHNAKTPNLPLSFSLGAATAHQNTTLAQTIIDADAAMYQHKLSKHLP